MLKTERRNVAAQKNRLSPANAEVGIVLFPTRRLGENNVVSGRGKVASDSAAESTFPLKSHRELPAV